MMGEPLWHLPTLGVNLRNDLKHLMMISHDICLLFRCFVTQIWDLFFVFSIAQIKLSISICIISPIPSSAWSLKHPSTFSPSTYSRNSRWTFPSWAHDTRSGAISYKGQARRTGMKNGAEEWSNQVLSISGRRPLRKGRYSIVLSLYCRFYFSGIYYPFFNTWSDFG
jgi:hypothetical protein